MKAFIAKKAGERATPAPGSRWTVTAICVSTVTPAAAEWPEDLDRPSEETSQTFSSLLVGVASIALLVGGIGILAMMVISVRERAREIGVRRAVGARRRDILLQFLLEAMALSLIGGIFGILVGLTAGVVLSRITGWPIAVSLPAAVSAAGVSAVIGIVFGTYPARRAAHVNPVVALRTE